MSYVVRKPLPCRANRFSDGLDIAIVTHKGASADGGHYIAWVKKSEVHRRPDSKPEALDVASEDWYKFDDDKVRF